ncbi:hypothetical protein V1514DRAFT_6883 [Lipomyces japonicus]|uniref:uncharacterized protein n=1 Tax=Lipomyces japonicus TaxID=56871 RepID=UPI0034CE4507
MEERAPVLQEARPRKTATAGAGDRATLSPAHQSSTRISNIYVMNSTTAAGPVTPSPSSRRRPMLSRPHSSSYSTTDSNRNSARKSNLSRHSDGSGISIRYSLALRGGEAYRSFSGASDILPGTINNDGNSDVVDYEEIDSEHVDVPDFHDTHTISEEVYVHQLENDFGSLPQPEPSYLGIPGFYYNETYNTSEEELDRSSISDSSFLEPAELELVDETNSFSFSSQTDPDDDHARVIEFDENGNLVSTRARRNARHNHDHDEFEQLFDDSDRRLSDADDASRYMPEFDYDATQDYSLQSRNIDEESSAEWVATDRDSQSSTRIIHPLATSTTTTTTTNWQNLDYVYRTRDVISEEDLRGQEVQMRAKRPEKALIPVYSEGLSLSTFPYMNSLAPLSATLRQQPKGHFATTVVGDCSSVESTILPPLALPSLQTGLTSVVGQRYGRNQELDSQQDLEAQGGRTNVVSDKDCLDIEYPLDMMQHVYNQSSKNELASDSFLTTYQQPYPKIARQQKTCASSVASVLLIVFICFPPMWFVLAFGGLDKAVGKVSKKDRLIAGGLGITFFTAALVGMAVGLGIVL